MSTTPGALLQAMRRVRRGGRHLKPTPCRCGTICPSETEARAHCVGKPGKKVSLVRLPGTRPVKEKRASEEKEK